MATGGGGGGGGGGSECGALRAGRPGRGYGSTAANHGGQRHLEHRPRNGDTLAGLALRYGVSTEQIKRANRLYTNDSIFLKESIRIPAPKQGGHPSAMRSVPDAEQVKGGDENSPESVEDRLSPELSPTDFLKRLDSRISHSKEAAIRNLADGGTRLPGGEGRSPPSAGGRCSTSEPVPAARRAQVRRARLGPVLLTKNTRVTTLRDTEDEIFDL